MWTLQDAKNRFSAVVEAALGPSARGQPPRSSSCRGSSAEEYARLVQVAAERRESFAEHLLHFPGGEVGRLQAKPRDVAF